jgi:hypothetical protein
MEEKLSKMPLHSEKTHLSTSEEAASEKDDNYNKEQKVPINGVDKNISMKPQVFGVPGLSKVAEDKIKNETEKQNFDEQRAEEWVEKWLPEEIIDVYALSYEKSKKSPEEKRKNKKYQKYYEKCQGEIKNYLKHRLGDRLLSGKLEEDASDKQVKETILKMLKSDLRATRLFEIMKNHNYQQNQELNKKEIPSLNNSEKEPTNNRKEEVKKVTLPNSIEEEIVLNKAEQLEIPKTREEFFQQFPWSYYVNKKDGSDLKILNYDSEKQKVSIYQYHSFVYNKENDSWGSSEEKNKEKTINYQDFLELMEDYSPDDDSVETEKDLERKELRGFYVNDKGEFFKPKEYFVQKNKKGKEEEFVKIEVGKDIRSNKASVLKVEDYHKFIKQGGFSFYENGKEMEEAFNKKLKRLKQEVKSFEILEILYHSGEGKYLVKIKKPDQKAEYVSFKKLLEMVKEDKNKKEGEKNIDLSNHFEQDEIDFVNNVVGGYIKDYKEELEEYLESQKEILGKDLIENIRDRYLKYFWEKELGEKLDSIQDIISSEKKEIVLSYLQNQFK